MKRLLLGCMIAALAATFGHSEEIRWRPARTNKPTLRVRLDGQPTRTTASPVSPVVYWRPAPQRKSSLKLITEEQQLAEPLPVAPTVEPPLIQESRKGDEIQAGPIPRAMPQPGAVPYGVVVPPQETLPIPAPEGAPPMVEPDWSCCDGLDEPACGEACAPCFDCCGTCALPKLWFEGEYLMWGIKNDSLPPMVTATTLTAAQLAALAGTPGFRPGALGQPGTVVLFGQGGINDANQPVFHGARITAGISGPHREVGLESTFFFLPERTRRFLAASNGTPGLFRPFFNVDPTVAGNPAEDAQLVALGSLSGSVEVINPTRLWGFEANMRKVWHCGCDWNLDFLMGFRFAELEESLIVRENLTFNQTITSVVGGQTIQINSGDNIRVEDAFDVRNRFYGGQVGAAWECRKGRWIFSVNGKLAIGAMNQIVNINGFTTFTPAGGAAVAAPGGLLAQPTNIGRFARTRFAVVPEIGLKLGYQLTDHLSVHVGYNLMYLSDVVRAGDQIDRVVNTSQVPAAVNRRIGGAGVLTGQARPVVLFRSTDFWAQGLTAGLRWEY